MSAARGQVCGWHYATREPIRVRWENGVITEIGSADSESAGNLWIAPGLFDLQVNGFGGVDFQQDDLSEGVLIAAVRQLRKAGCTRFLPTLITDDWHAIVARLQRLRHLRSQSRELRQTIAGWHIEGPFLSTEPGFRGAHDASRMCNPTPDLVRELRVAAGEDPLLLTLAPERPGSLEAIGLAASLGMRVNVGHTNAPVEIIRQAVQAGAKGFTHLGNGCPRELDRHDNILWRVFDSPGLTVSLIPDTIHVSPALFRLAHKALGPDSIIYVTDAMAAAGAPPGRYRLGKLELEVGPDQIVRQPGTPFFAGSALRPIEGVFRAAQMLGTPWQDTWLRFSERPAAFMGLRGGLATGLPADFCTLSLSADNHLGGLRVYVGGIPEL